AENLVVGTFSTDGPLKCSGLEIKQYNESSMEALFKTVGFIQKETKREDHITPFQTVQNFVFMALTKKN
ncbi:MAG: SAM-dependent methyltransferase, partial [Crocinitomicaceae bacterium]